MPFTTALTSIDANYYSVDFKSLTIVALPDRDGERARNKYCVQFNLQITTGLNQQ